MSRPNPEPFPAANESIAHIECAAGSQRTPDESLSQPCHVCGHTACRIGPKGPVPCESCLIYIYVRGIFDQAAGGTGSLQHLTDLVAHLDARQTLLERRINTADTFPI